MPLAPEIRLHLAHDPIALWEHTEQALASEELPPPFWAFAWPGGQALARYLLDHPGAVSGRPVTDVAAGSGVAAIAAALAGGEPVTCYDVDPLAEAAIAANAAANGVTLTARCEDILAGAPGKAPTGVVLIADAFYQRELAARMMRFAEAATAAGASLLVADPGRAYLPRGRFTPLATYDVPGVAALEDADVKRTTIWAPAW